MIIKMTLQQQVSTSRSFERKVDQQDIEIGLDFILEHFNQERLFPRKISTYKYQHKQTEIFSREEVLQCFEESNYLDCRINSFPSYTEYKGIQRYPPDFIFIDLDQNSFKTDKSFKLALSKTLKNIKEKLDDNTYPTVNWSGSGYHIILPIECPILEETEQFRKYENDKPSQEFLRFAKDFLSNGSADKSHYPSFKSCLIRIPNSINYKCLVNKRNERLLGNFRVKILQRWNGYRSSITREFLEEFRTYLEQKITDQENNIYNNKKNNNYQNHYSNNNHIEWIEKQILQKAFSDYRKLIVGLILAPYLIVIKKLSYEKSYQIISEWLQKCDSVRKLDFDPKYLTTNNLKTSAKKMENNLGIIDTRFCEKSEFSNDKWAKSYC